MVRRSRPRVTSPLALVAVSTCDSDSFKYGFREDKVEKDLEDGVDVLGSSAISDIVKAACGSGGNDDDSSSSSSSESSSSSLSSEGDDEDPPPPPPPHPEPPRLSNAIEWGPFTYCKVFRTDKLTDEKIHFAWGATCGRHTDHVGKPIQCKKQLSGTDDLTKRMLMKWLVTGHGVDQDDAARVPKPRTDHVRGHVLRERSVCVCDV